MFRLIFLVLTKDFFSIKMKTERSK